MPGRQLQAGAGGFAFHVLAAAQAPGGVFFPQALVKPQVARRGHDAVFQIRAVGDERAVGRQVPGAAAHQRGAGGPGRDVQHVGAENGVKNRGVQPGLVGQPARCHHVEQQGRAHIGQTLPCQLRGQAAQRAGLRLGGLPGPMRQAGGKPGNMLAGARGNLQGAAAFGQHLAQHLQNRLLVALGGGAEIGWRHGEGLEKPEFRGNLEVKIGAGPRAVCASSYAKYSKYFTSAP